MINVGLLPEIRLSWAEPAAAGHYCVSRLSAGDLRRATSQRGAKARLDWQVSRALLHACREGDTAASAESLSHSRGHAMLAQAPRGWSLGADMEKIRPRRVLALAEWACSAGEIEWLRGLPDGGARLQGFYLLWTLKEAFIKACSLSFPADLCRYGLDVGPASSLSLRAPVGAWQARSYLIGSDWMASVVWLPQGHDLGVAEPQWHACPASIMPQVKLINPQKHQPFPFNRIESSMP